MTRAAIQQTLIMIGMPTTLLGFSYIVDAVMLMNEPEWKHPKWTSLYKYIANKYGTNSTSVERNIRTALATTRECRGCYDDVEYYLGFINTNNSNSLTLLYMRLSDG